VIGSYPVMNLGRRLGQAQALPPAVAAQWVSKIQSAMADVTAIQAWVSSHATQAASVGLDKDAANLPASGKVEDYPALSALVAALNAGQPVDQGQLSCIDQLQAATAAAKAKMAAFTPSFADFIQSPTGIGVAAGVGAVGVGLLHFL
jgi:hypothetical protein